jgi:gas vesicle protein
MLLFTGALIGAGVALLLAPQSGKATRHDIARYSRRARRKASHVIDDFTGKVSEMVERVGETAEEVLDRKADFTSTARKELLAALEAGRDQLEAQRTRLSKLLG